MRSKTHCVVATACVAAFAAACTFSFPLPDALAQEAAGEDQVTLPADGGEPQSLERQLVGAWKLVAAKTPGNPSGIGTRLKTFTGTRWLVLQPDARTGVIVFVHGGRYEVDGDLLKTTCDFAGPSTRQLIGKPGRYRIAVDGDTMRQADSNDVFNETWERVD